jgi:hypothetical protein
MWNGSKTCPVCNTINVLGGLPQYHTGASWLMKLLGSKCPRVPHLHRECYHCGYRSYEIIKEEE